nr:MAG TPA: hypothetical protein [Caudoviricetes sp.]
MGLEWIKKQCFIRGTHYTGIGHRMVKPKSDGRII